MSIYDNEKKIYPDLNPIAPQEPQLYRLNKLSEIEVYFFNESEVCEQIAEKLKQFNTITGILDTGLIASTVITGGISIAAFASGVGLPQVELAYFFLLQLSSHGSILKSSS